MFDDSRTRGVISQRPDIRRSDPTDVVDMGRVLAGHDLPSRTIPVLYYGACRPNIIADSPRYRIPTGRAGDLRPGYPVPM